MKRVIGALLVAAFSFVVSPVRADDAAATAVIDKAIKALGGQEKLAKADAMSWKSKGVFTFNDNESEFTGQTTARGLTHFRSEFEGTNGRGMTVVAGDQGWSKFGDNARKLEGEMLDAAKRRIYLQVVPMVLVPLKGKDFKIESTADETVDGKPAAVIKVTGPDGKSFKLLFDKESGLPVKQLAETMGFGGQEFTMETTFADYKDFDGIKKATKLVSKRDGQAFMTAEITEFKVLDRVEDSTFAEP